MEFSNLIAYCKNWYKHSGDVNTMWKDMCHCVMCDGYLCNTKREVAQFCMNKMVDFAKKYPEQAYKVTFSAVFSEIEKNKMIFETSRRHNYELRDIKLDDYDHICWAFRNIFAWIDGDVFDSGIIPSDKVLPLNDDISDTLWEKVKNYKEQITDNWWFDDFETRDSRIIEN